MTLRLTHASGRFNRSPASLALALDRLAVNADILTGTEVAKPARGKALTLPGWTLTHEPGPQRGETFVTVRPGLPVVASGAEQVSTLRFRRKGWWATWAVVDTEDGKTLVSVAHTPASWRILRQRKSWRDGVAHWSTLVDRLAKKYGCTRTIVAADWNRNLASEAVRAELEAAFPGFTVVAPDKPTHDVRRIDGLLVRGYTGTGHTLSSAALRAASDHRPAIFTLVPTGKPQEAPVTRARIDGVDLSHWQNGALDLKAAKAGGVKFLYHKTTEGDAYIDPNYAGRRDASAAAGIPFGGYHFARPGDPVAQAKRFLSVAKPKPGDLRPMLDLEDGTIGGWSIRKRTRWVGAFVGAVAAATGEPCVIYTRQDLGDTFDCPLWTARYSNAMSAPAVAKPWKAWSIWQFSDGVYGSPNTAPGIGRCDLNTFNSGVSVDTIRLGASKPVPAPKPAPARPSVNVQAGRRINSAAKTAKRRKVADLLRSIANRLIQKG